MGWINDAIGLLREMPVQRSNKTAEIAGIYRFTSIAAQSWTRATCCLLGSQCQTR